MTGASGQENQNFAARAPTNPFLIIRPIDNLFVEVPVMSCIQRYGFKSGEFIVYPAHGVGQISGIEEQDIAGSTLELLIINFKQNKMTLRIPTSKFANVKMLCVGVRSSWAAILTNSSFALSASRSFFIYSSLRLGLYEPFKRMLGATDPKNTPFYLKFLAGGMSGFIGAALANPTDLLKVRMQAWEGKPHGLIWHTKYVYSHWGLAGFY